MKIAFNTKLLSNNTHQTYFLKACGIDRFTWNWGLAEWYEQYRLSQSDNTVKKPNGKALKKVFNSIKKAEFPWMYEVTKYAAQQPFIKLQKAWDKFFKDLKSGAISAKPRKDGKLAGMPRFKKKGRCTDSFYVGGDHIQVKGRYLRLPKLGWIKMAEPLPFGGHINSITISRHADRWMVSFQCDVDYSPLPVKSQDSVGIDVGINALVTASDGSVWHSPKPFAQAKRQLARYQRRLAKKVKGSGGYRKLAMKIARLHRRIANIRKNTLHHISRYLTDHFAVIAMEDLNIRGMMKNRKLARHIAEMGWYELFRQLKYKAEWKGGAVEKTGKWFPSSQLCNRCGEKHPCLTLSDRVFNCPSCGNSANRDSNAALNIRDYTVRFAGIYAD